MVNWLFCTISKMLTRSQKRQLQAKEPDPQKNETASEKDQIDPAKSHSWFPMVDIGGQSSSPLPASTLPENPAELIHFTSQHDGKSKLYQGDKVLRDLFYTFSSPTSFAPPLKLYLAARKIDPFITLDRVERWLSRQPAYTQYRVNHQRFKRRKVLVRGAGWQFQADLMDMHNLSRENKGNKFLLTVIDCFSRLATAIPIRSKHAHRVVDGMKLAFNQLGTPQKLQTDAGKEFYNTQMKSFLRQRGVILFSTDQELKAQIVERFNRTIRDKIKKYLIYAKTLKYIDVLPQLLQSYNRAKHRSLRGFSPIEVNKQNEKTVFHHQYDSYLKARCKAHKFQVGDQVRAMAKKFHLIKDLPTFENEIFEIIESLATDPPMYRLKRLSTGSIVRGAYYENQLQKVWPAEKSSSARQQLLWDQTRAQA